MTLKDPRDPFATEDDVEEWYEYMEDGMSDKVEYSQKELEELITLVKEANHSDELPIYTWARAAKVFAEKIAELEDG